MRIVCIAPVPPYSGIPHAGGEYLRRHLTVLAAEHDVTLVVPDIAPLPSGCAVDPDVPLLRAAAGRWSAGRTGPVIQSAAKIGRPLSPNLPWRASLTRQPDAAAAIAEADIVELQWPEYAGLAPAVHAANPRARIVVVEHDVLSQRESRHLRSSAGRKAQLRALLTLPTLHREERRLLGLADLVLVFSEKDRELLARSRVASRVEVIDPPLDEPGMPGEPVVRPEGREVLFPAAFDRAVNHEAGMWLLESVWPLVLDLVPDARLTFGGNGPRAELVAAAESAGVRVTGRVDDLGELYRDSDVVVAPLLAGAGVKFKVLTSLLWGVPVVATSVGAEGIPGDEDLLLAVTDDPAAFASAVAFALTDPAARGVTAARAQTWARSRFGTTRFAERLLGLYDEVAP